MDISYWEQRSNGLWLKNEYREHFIKREYEFSEEEFKLIVSATSVQASEIQLIQLLIPSTIPLIISEPQHSPVPLQN